MKQVKSTVNNIIHTYWPRRFGIFRRFRASFPSSGAGIAKLFHLGFQGFNLSASFQQFLLHDFRKGSIHKRTVVDFVG